MLPKTCPRNPGRNPSQEHGLCPKKIPRKKLQWEIQNYETMSSTWTYHAWRYSWKLYLDLRIRCFEDIQSDKTVLWWQELLPPKWCQNGATEELRRMLGNPLTSKHNIFLMWLIKHTKVQFYTLESTLEYSERPVKRKKRSDPFCPLKRSCPQDQ